MMINPCHIGNVSYNARSNRGYPPTSPNTSLARKNDSHDECSSRLKRYLYNARSNRVYPPTSPNTAPATKNDSPIFQRNFWKTVEMRERSENDPSMIKPSVRNPPRNRGYFSRSPRAFSSEKYISRSGYHSKFHQMLPLPQKVTVELFTKYCDCHEK